MPSCIYAQLTLGDRKKVDLLLDGDKELARVEVKTERGNEWPAVKGIAPRDGLKFLVLVDLKSKRETERPDFYVINREEWPPFLTQHLTDRSRDGVVTSNEHDLAVASGGFLGVGIKPKEVEKFRDRWDKIVDPAGPRKLQAPDPRHL